MIKTLSIDLETYSDIDITKSGNYKYAESENFEILLFAYSINNEEVQIIDLACGEQISKEIMDAIISPEITKWAYNANFERICLSNWFTKHHPEYMKGQKYLSPDSWNCSMVWAAYMGLPLSLEGVGAVLKLENQKLKEGRDLIRYFCKPCNPTKTNGGRTRNLPYHAPEKWESFKAYNKRDVEVELAIQQRLHKYPVPAFIWDEYHLDQKINDHGIEIDMDLAQKAIRFDTITKDSLTEEMHHITNLDNPNSVIQLKDWLSQNGLETTTLGKKDVAELIKSTDGIVQQALFLRLMLAKSSVKKYQAMLNVACSDNRARGMFQFYGANRSGRWAGRLIQLQNLPQNHLDNLDEVRCLVKNNDFDAVANLYVDIPDTLSQLIRTAFIPKNGYKFIVSDFAAIEARVLSHLAKENWRTEVFKKNGDIYCASASAMFHVPVEKHGQNSHLRQKGKIAELALGYGGSVGALKAMGALNMGIREDELQPLVDAWRKSNPHIVNFWWDVDKAVKLAIKKRTLTETHGIYFSYKSGMLFIELHSGRKLCYVKPKIGENQFGGESVTYEGIGTTKKWERIESYGPKFVENIVQAISRDILMFALQNLKNYNICGHIHDEIIIECPKDTDINNICTTMAINPPWFPDAILRADGYETEFYKKD